MPILPPFRLPIPEWKPDQPELADGAQTIDGVVPLTEASYGPVGSYVNFASALTGRCQGSAAIQDLSGNNYLFSGDATKLYNLATGDIAYTDISRVAGGAYNCPSDDYWPIVAFGNRVIASNINDGMETFLIGTDSNFSDLGGGSPKAKYLLVVRDFLVAANTADGTSGSQPMRVWWSAVGDPTSFPTPGTSAAVEVQSDYQDMIGDYGPIVGLVGPLGAADAAVVMERGIWRMQYAGSPAIFDFSLAAGTHGSQAPMSLVNFMNRLYYLGDDDFYVFDGVQVEPLGAQKWANYFFANVDINFINRVQGAADPLTKLIFWGYPTLGSAGTITDVIAYNWLLNRGSHFALTTEWMGRSAITGLTLDQLGELDTLLFPLDSRVYSGGRPILSLFDTDHRMGFLTGANIAATVETSEGQVFPGRRGRYNSARPLVDGGAPSVALGVRDRLVDSTAWKTAVAMNRLGASPQRSTGRYVKGRITLPAGSNFTHIQGLDLEATPEGLR